jgi:YfiH family protein
MHQTLHLLRPDWPLISGTRAVSTTRAGGVSVAAYESLNLGAHVGDGEAAVRSNRGRLQSTASLPAEPVWLRQVHGNVVADLDLLDEPTAVVADAAVSSAAGRVCAVLTADCLPLLLAAADGSVVAAVHAGWRGLAAGVIEAALQALRVKAPAGTFVHAWLGPAIGAAHFEVGAEVRAAFMRHDAAAQSAFTANAAGRWQCDLYALARQRLRAHGVTSIWGGGFCTYADDQRFYSHRRDVQHRGLAGTGRMASLIWRT